MEDILQKTPDINAVFAQNDEMALGVIEVIMAAGLKPGDLKIVSVDGTRPGFQAMVDGWVQADVAGNPLLGPQVLEMALKLMNGQPVDQEVLTDATVYHLDDATKLMSQNCYKCY